MDSNNPSETEVASPADPSDARSPARVANVQSVEVALVILEAIAGEGGPVRVNELARRLDMTKTKVSRHLQTLLALGLVAKAHPEGYTFGWKLLQLGRAAMRDRDVAHMASPHLHQLRDSTGQTVILSTPVPHGAVVVSCVESLAGASVRVRPARVLLLPRSPSARLAVALQPPRADGSLPPEGSSLKHWPHFGAEYEVDTGNGVGGVSAPVRDEEGMLLCIVSIVAPASQLRPWPSKTLVHALGECVQAIEAAYAGKPPTA